MATNDQPTNGVRALSEVQAHLAIREALALSHPGGPRASGGDQVRGTRRRSSTFRRAAHNVENFSHNRHRDDAAVRFAHRVRTRSVARIETEQQQHQQQQEQQRHQQEQASPDVSGAQSTISPQQNGSAEEWKPSIVIGSSLWTEGEDLNAIQIADRKVAQTRLWVDHYRGVPYFVQAHQKALEERAQLDESAEENTKPRSTLKSTHDDAIHDRLDVLRTLLQDSNFPPERANIEAAISGYQSGAIPYSDAYTLLWAGQIVDRCADFDAFTQDRTTRLGRYAATHGPGWLWYEPPLSSSNSSAGTHRGPTILAKKGFCLESKQAWRQGTENMGHYNIRMGFRRRKCNVTRGTTHTHTTPTTSSIPHPDTSPPHSTTPDPDGPQLIYNMLLDSGATLPTLWAGDLPALGIEPARYAAQSARRVNTADSVLVSRVYELDVRVLGGEESAPVGLFRGSLRRRRPRREAGAGAGAGSPGGFGGVAAASAAVVGAGAEGGEGGGEDEGGEEEEDEALSCTIPVLVFPGESKDFGGGDHVPDRLSGLLPFHVCYLSGAPGSFKLWMGEERRDVLGAGRLPGMMRYGEILGGAQSRARRAPASTTLKLGQWRSEGLRTPERVIFEHDLVDDAEGVLRDEDVGDGNAIMRGPRGTDFDNIDTKADSVQVLHIGRKRKRAYQEARRRGSAVTKPAKKKIKSEQTGERIA
ncbi:hypothetical protein B0I37DRAFT_400740 [Chaetomium sp. MPI-CAGE-AT-0009]|nr:hypothetical protein B0I37DRAFT_400740 [Chaetomium sp. MPI-CAGE-AT-0009]